MSARLRFWTLFAACLVAAVTVFVLAVPKKLQAIDERAADLETSARRAQSLAPDAVGAVTLEAAKAERMQARLEAAKITEAFEAHDAAHLDRWFPGLELAWSEVPSADEFKRLYLVNLDALVREASAALDAAGVAERELGLISYPWMRSNETPDRLELRDLQREFWVQDRVVRALARVGARTAQPLAGGDEEASVGLDSVVFKRLRWRVEALCPPTAVRRALHAFDGPDAEGFGLHAVVHRVVIERQRPTRGGSTARPPVRLAFDLSVLDHVGASR